MTDNGFKRQPNSRHCFVCGLESKVGLRMRFDDNGVDEVRAEYMVCADHQGYPDVAHGGVVAAMLDEAGARTSMIADPNRFMMTGKMEIRYRQPVPTETPLIVCGIMLNDRGRMAQVRSEIRLPDGTVAAEAEIMIVAIPPESVPGTDWESLGWRVYDDEN